MRMNMKADGGAGLDEAGRGSSTPASDKKRGFAWGSLTLRLFAILILPLTILLLALTFWSLTVHQRAMRTLVGERDERAVQTLAAALSGAISQRAAAVQSLASQAASTSRPDLEEVLDGYAYLLDGSILSLALFNPDGSLLAQKGDPAFWEGVVTENGVDVRELFPLDASGSRISGVIPHSYIKGGIVYLSAQAGDPESGRVLIAAGAISPGALANRILGAALPPGQEISVLLVAPEGEVLYMHGPSEAGEDPHGRAGVAEALTGDTGTTYLHLDGSEYVVAYTRVEPVGWALVMQEPWEMVASPLLSYTQMAPLVLVPALLLMLLALWFAVRQIVQPLQKLASQAISLAWGNFSAVEEPVGGISEIQRVQESLAYLSQKVQAAQQSLRGYIGAITTGQEEERRRLARELHDDTLQSLIALKQRVQLAQLHPQDEALLHSLSELEELTERAIEDLRRVTRALRPIYLEELGLSAALGMLAKETGQAADIDIDFSSHGPERRLPSRVELALYRMAQEALSNIVRHARASRASLTLEFGPQGVELEIRDNGQGFEPPKSPAEYAPAGHFGLLGLYERAELIGAHLEIRSIIGAGTQIRITLPVIAEGQG